MADVDVDADPTAVDAPPPGPWWQRLTDRVGQVLVDAWPAAEAHLRGSWPATIAPRTRAEAWQASKVDVSRIPQAAGAELLEAAWMVWNWIDRPILFALATAVSVIPGAGRVAGAGFWLAERPCRRYPFYVITSIAAAWIWMVL